MTPSALKGGANKPICIFPVSVHHPPWLVSRGPRRCLSSLGRRRGSEAGTFLLSDLQLCTPHLYGIACVSWHNARGALRSRKPALFINARWRRRILLLFPCSSNQDGRPPAFSGPCLSARQFPTLPRSVQLACCLSPVNQSLFFAAGRRSWADVTSGRLDAGNAPSPPLQCRCAVYMPGEAENARKVWPWPSTA